MSPAAEILVIILSIFLAFFLILGIVLTIYLINLTRQIREVTKSAGRTVDNMESIVEKISNFTSPLIVAGMITKFMKKFKKDKEEK
jgi:predicted PurR-regulated permease PerM